MVGVLERTVLGINAVYHQPSACLVRGGRVIAAVEEERFNRRKGGKEAHVDNTMVLPYRSIEWVLRAGGITLAQVDRIATSFSLKRREAGQDLFSRYPPILGGGYETPDGDRAFRRMVELMPEALGARFDEEPDRVRSRFEWVPHHLSHLASSFYASPFREAAGLVIDGIGENDTTTLADCTPAGIEVLRTVDYPHSLGFVWEVITGFLGFQGNLDECKIMGLAAYGKPDAFRESMDRILSVDENGQFVTRIGPEVLDGDYRQLRELFHMEARLPYEPLAWEGADRHHADLAAALQEKTNEIFLRLAIWLRKQTGRRFLVMAGGVTLNCVANGLVAEQAGFEDVFIQPAAGDAGSAIGAALAVAHSLGDPRPVEGAMPHAFLGPCFDDAEIEKALRRFRLPFLRVDDPVEAAARMLAEGKVVGWFQGPMEFGPRALGSRSLLANPTLPGIRHTLNLQVKHREEFRPFCPTVLAEHASEWFEHANPFCSASRVMLATYFVRPEKREFVPAIMHRDGSSRLQLLHRQDNPLFHALVSAFYRLTGVPMLLNTSFNDREPIVCTPEDACRTWLKTRFDAMVIGPFLVTGLKPWERRPGLSAFEREAMKFDAGDDGRSEGRLGG